MVRTSERDHDHRSGKDDYKATLVSLAKSSTDANEILQKLRKLYSNDKIVQEKFLEYSETLDRVRRKAQKFVTRMIEKYGANGFGQRDMMRKALKFAEKYKMSSAEMELFQYLLSTEKNFISQNFAQFPNTEMGRTLGTVHLNTVAKLNYSSEDEPYLNNIVKLTESTKQLYDYIKFQTLTYSDCSMQVITGSFDRNKHNPLSHVHPVIVALFFPKVKYLDDVMLLASIGNIVKMRSDGSMVKTLQDYELMWSLITDPNDLACKNSSSAMKDLDLRFKVQIKLWETVLSLRQGRFYDDKIVEFLSLVDKCQSNLFDAPDLMYSRDEGTLLRKLLGVYSMRPTLVSMTNVMPQTMSTAPYPTINMAHQMTKIAMLTVYVAPPSHSSTDGISDAPETTLSFNLQTNRWFVKNNTIVQKSIQIMTTRDVMFVHVPRRYHKFNTSLMHGNATREGGYAFQFMPVSFSQLQVLNKSPLAFDYNYNIGGCNFNLRSVVFVETSSHMPDAIIGSSAGVIKTIDVEKGVFEERCYLYSPLSVMGVMSSQPAAAADGTTKPYFQLQPIVEIGKYSSEVIQNVQAEPMLTAGITPSSEGKEVEISSFNDRARHTGTVFMFCADKMNALEVFASV